MRRLQGFTLIELLVGLALATLLGLLIFISFTSLESNGIRGSDTAQLQTNARVSMTLLSDDIARAGFMMNGPSGQSRCARLLTYNSNLNTTQMTNQWPLSATVQTTAGLVPGTPSTAFNYAAPGGAATDAISIFYASGFGLANQAMPGGVRVVKATNGTLVNAALFVANTSAFNVGDVDIVVLPARNLCIRFQVTGTGGTANNIVHNSGKSPINPPNGFTGVSTLANPPISPALTTADLAQAYVQNFGQSQGATGPILVTYSVRPDPNSATTPDLWRTVVNATGQIVSDAPIAKNVVLLHALFAPVINGQLQGFVPWSTISSNNQQGQVGAVQFAYVVRKPNTASRTNNPAALAVLDETFTPASGNLYQYQVFSQTVYLRNVAWNQS
jgi:prepilin-type N-terminal cleavage/methylation domain-containing protein